MTVNVTFFIFNLLHLLRLRRFLYETLFLKFPGFRLTFNSNSRAKMLYLLHAIVIIKLYRFFHLAAPLTSLSCHRKKWIISIHLWYPVA